MKNFEKNEKFSATFLIFRYFSLFLRAKSNLSLCKAITRPREPLKMFDHQKNFIVLYNPQKFQVEKMKNKIKEVAAGFSPFFRL